MPETRKRRKSPKGPGYTIRQFAEAVNESQHVIRRAVAEGTIFAIDFNGIKRIPPREKARWIETWGESKSAMEAVGPREPSERTVGPHAP